MSLDSLRGALADRYTIERELGQGGMATVYLAQDLKHQRKVALKVLHPELAAALGSDRFLAEIRTTANLQHPNIVPLFDSGEADGFVYYVMPYVAGESLREKLEREGRFDVATAVGIARGVAQALATAHEAGVVHRDIKPENILLVRDQPIVADFGIARAVDQAGGERLTATGMAVGTPAYMSPEQALGEATLDARSDLYSLGCVIYEMLAGSPPFSGGTVQALIAQRLVGPPPALTSVPPAVNEVVRRSLATAPQDRFATALALADALVAAASRPGTVQPLIVVLPFVNRSSEPDTEYFSDGLTDEVISDLSHVAALRVISRNSSMMLKGTTKDTRTVSRELGVTHLVTGTVRRAGAALRVTAELVEASTDTPIWSDKLSGTMDDVFQIQEEISRQIVSALKVTLTEREARTVAERPFDDPVAYDCYLRAVQLIDTWTPEDQARALRLVDDAIALAGDLPLLLATKANIWWTQVNIHVVPAEEGLPHAAELVDRALAIDPDCYLAIHVRGLVAGTRGKPEQALADILRAHQLRPSDVNILSELQRYANFSGLRAGPKYSQRLVELAPMSTPSFFAQTYAPHIFGPCEQAAEPARRGIALAPEASWQRLYLAWPLAAAGFREEAAEVLSGLGTVLTNDPHGPFALFLSYALRGRVEEALRVATPEMERTIHNDIACRMMADGYALLDRKADALRWLRTAIEHGFINYPNLTGVDTFLESLWLEPEFQALMAELKPRWEALIEWERGLPA